MESSPEREAEEADRESHGNHTFYLDQASLNLGWSVQLLDPAFDSENRTTLGLRPEREEGWQRKQAPKGGQMGDFEKLELETV